MSNRHSLLADTSPFTQLCCSCHGFVHVCHDLLGILKKRRRRSTFFEKKTVLVMTRLQRHLGYATNKNWRWDVPKTCHLASHSPNSHGKLENSPMLYTNYIFKWSMFHCYVSFPGVWDWHQKNIIPSFKVSKKNVSSRVYLGIFISCLNWRSWQCLRGVMMTVSGHHFLEPTFC